MSALRKASVVTSRRSTDFIDEYVPPHLQTFFADPDLEYQFQTRGNKPGPRSPVKPDGKDWVPNSIARIGCSGWDWQNNKSIYCTWEIDCGHGSNSLSEEQIEQLIETFRTSEIPGITVTRSTGGKGLHFRLWIKPIPTTPGLEGRADHKRTCKRACMKVAELSGVDLPQMVDACGLILWGGTIDNVPGTFDLLCQNEGELEIDPLINISGFKGKEPKVKGPWKRGTAKDFNNEQLTILECSSKYGSVSYNEGFADVHTYALQQASFRPKMDLAV